MFYDQGASANARMMVAVWAKLWTVLQKYRRFTERDRSIEFLWALLPSSYELPKLILRVNKNIRGFLLRTAVNSVRAPNKQRRNSTIT